MDASERLSLLKQIQKGEQNRYGEIEYELNDTQRLVGLENILESANTSPLSSSESQSIKSIIYWNLCNNITVVHKTCKIVHKYSHLDFVRKGLLEGMGDRYTFSSRVRHLKNIIEYFKTLNLSFSPEIKSEIQMIIDTWRNLSEWDRYSLDVENMLYDLQ